MRRSHQILLHKVPLFEGHIVKANPFACVETRFGFVYLALKFLTGQIIPLYSEVSDRFYRFRAPGATLITIALNIPVPLIVAIRIAVQFDPCVDSPHQPLAKK